MLLNNQIVTLQHRPSIFMLFQNMHFNIKECESENKMIMRVIS